jgi:hypothetical protein
MLCTINNYLNSPIAGSTHRTIISGNGLGIGETSNGYSLLIKTGLIYEKLSY